MPINPKVKQIYDTLKDGGADVGSEKEFNDYFFAKGKDGYNNRKKVFNTLKDGGADAGKSYEEFAGWLGLHAVKPKPATPQHTVQATNPAPARPVRTQPTRQQKPQGKPMTAAQKAAAIGWAQGLAAQTKANTQRAMQKIKNIGKYQKAQGVYGQAKKGNIEYNPKTGKMEQTYLTPQGEQTTHKATADLASHEFRVQQGFLSRMSDNGLNPDNPEDVAKQRQLDKEHPIRDVLDSVWKEAEGIDKQAQEELRSKASSGFNLATLAEASNSAGAPLAGHDRNFNDELSYQEKRHKAFDFDKMANTIYSRLPKDYRNDRLREYTAYFSKHPKETKGKSAVAAAKDALMGQIYNNVYSHAVQERLPKSNLEFLLRKVADQPLFSIKAAAEFAASSMTGSHGLEVAERDAMAQFGSQHKAMNIMGTVANMALDPITYVSGGVGGFVGKKALGLAGKAMLGKVAEKATEKAVGKVATDVASRYAAGTLAGRVVQGVAGGAANFATFNTLKGIEEQVATGGVVNPETGKSEGFSVGEILKSTGHGLLLGAATGTLSPIIGNFADKAVKATTSTVGKVALRAGEAAVSTLAEGTVFSIPEWISGQGDAFDVWTDNMGMMLGFKASHAIKSAPRVLDALRTDGKRYGFSFKERLNKQMEASPSDAGFTSEELDELRNNGYMDLSMLFRNAQKQKNTNPKSHEVSKEVIDDYENLTPDTFDGYEAMKRLMNDKGVSEATRAKAYYILTGRMLPMSTITGYTMDKTEDGDIVVKSMSAQGDVVTSRQFTNEKAAQGEIDKIMRQSELNSVDVGEKYKETASNMLVVETAIKEVAPDADMETVLQNYRKVKSGQEDMPQELIDQAKAIDAAIERNRDIADANRPEAIRAKLKKETGLDVDATLRKMPKDRTEEEKGLVDTYIKSLFPEQEKTEDGQTADVQADTEYKQRIEERQQAYDEGKEAFNVADTEGDNSDTDAIVLRYREAYDEIERVFADDAEMRIAQLEEDPWEVMNDQSLTPEQQDAVAYFVNSKAAMDGLTEAANENSENKRAEAEYKIAQRTNKQSGMIHPATLKVDDKQVYIISGNVTMFPDGSTVDIHHSSESVVVCDAETGELKFISPEQIYKVDEPVDPSMELKAVDEAISAEQQAILGNEAETEVSESEEMPEQEENGQPQAIQQDDAVEETNLDVQNENEVNLPQSGNIQQNSIESEVNLPQNETDVQEPSALNRIPKGDNGEPLYEQTDPETAWDAIVEQTEGDTSMAQTVADDMVADLEAGVKKAEKSKTKRGGSISEKIAAEKERAAVIEQAKATLAHWRKIAAVNRMREAAMQAEEQRKADEVARVRKEQEEKARVEQEEAERIKREVLNGVPDFVEDKATDARARGYRRVNGDKVDRQEPINATKGKEVQVKFDDDNIPTGHVAIIEANQLQPSHKNGQRNPQHFIDEAQPKERKDDASVGAARKIAANIRPEEITSSVTAYTGAPIVNSRGEVIQGNNRSAALHEMWDNYQEQGDKYKQYLIDNAESFGLRPEDIAAMDKPVLVNMLDVNDDEAISLGQFVASDTESGGTERIKPKNVVKKLGDKMKNFANILLRANDENISFAELVDSNGVNALKWLNANGVISPTQYKSAFDSKGNITAEAKNDIKGIMYQSIFEGGNTQLEEMFNTLPAKAQKAILATAFRDYDSPQSERMIGDIQDSIMAYYALSHDSMFMNAKNHKDARIAVEAWRRQLAFDDVTGESYLPAEKYSNFALLLATMYKGDNQSLIQGTFNRLYDLIQGTQEETLFEQPDNTPRSLAQAIKETLNIEYNGQQGSNVLAGDNSASQGGRTGSNGDATSRGRSEDVDGAEANQGGTERDTGRSGSRQSSGGSQEEVAAENSHLTKKEAADFIAQMELGADVAQEIPLTIENWDKEFGEDGIVSTPIGDVKMGENQFAKLMRAGRNGKLGMLKPTLEYPDAIVEENSKAKEGTHTERPSSFIFIKSFRKSDGTRYYYFTSITVSVDGKEVVVSNQEKSRNRILRLLMEGSVIWRTPKDATTSSAEKQGLDYAHPDKAEGETKGSVITPQNTPSVGKDSKQSDTKQEKSDETAKKEAVSEDLFTMAERVAAEDKAKRTRKKEEAKVDTNPTEAQKEAGNYKKGHIKVDGFNVTIEQPKGSVRRGKDANGKEWETEMHNTYGYIRGTESVDGDHIDIFLSDNPTDGNVFVVDQVNKDGSFDEHKVMYGFSDMESARKAYLSNYEEGWQGLGNITEVSKEEFKKWIDSSKRKTKPFAEYSSVRTQGDVQTKKPTEAEDFARQDLKELEDFQKNTDTAGRTTIDVDRYEVEDLFVPLLLDGKTSRLGVLTVVPDKITNPSGQIAVYDYSDEIDEKTNSGWQKWGDLTDEYNKMVDSSDKAQERGDTATLGFTSVDAALKFYDWLNTGGPKIHQTKKSQKEIKDSNVFLSQKEYIEKELVSVLKQTKYKTLEEWEDKDTENYAQKYDDFLETYEDYVRDLAADEKLQAIYDKSSVKTQKEIREYLTDADLDYHEFINTSPKRLRIQDRLTRKSKYAKGEFSDGTIVSGEVVRWSPTSLTVNSRGTLYTISANKVLEQSNEPMNVDGHEYQENGSLQYSTEDLTNNTTAKRLATDTILSALNKAGIEVVRATDEQVQKLFANTHASSLRTPQGTIYGWAVDGKIYLTEAGINPDTPIHEYTHLWAEAMMSKNKKGWNSIKALLKETPVWNEVVADPNYSNITNNEDAVASEVLSRISGRENAARMESEAQKVIDEDKDVFEKAKSVTLLNRIKRALDMFWKWVGKELFKIKKFGSINEVTDRVLYDLMHSTKLNSNDKSLIGVHNISEQKLRKVLKQGGFANPSIAVIDTDKQVHNDYGEISLILPSRKINKSTGKNAGTFEGDAWTPMYPVVEKQISSDGRITIHNDINAVPKDMQSEVRNALNRWLENGSDTDLSYLYLFQQGKAPQMIVEKPKYSNEVHKTLNDIMFGVNSVYNLSKNEIKKLVELYIQTELDGNIKEYNEAIQRKISKYEELIKRGKPNSLRYRVADSYLEDIEKYGYPLSPLINFVDDVQRDKIKQGSKNAKKTINTASQIIKDAGLEKDFKNWVEGLNNRYQTKEVIFDGFTPTGKRRYMPNTLENVSKIMKKQGRQASAGISISFSNFAAAVMKANGSLDNIRKKKNKLTNEHKDIEDFEEKWKEVYFDLAMKLQPNANMFDDYGFARLQEAANEKNPQTYIRNVYGITLSEEDVQKLQDLVEAIREERPALYFETKFERPVYLNEFSKAVVPEDFSDDLQNALRESGIEVFTYKRGDVEDRQRVTKQASYSSNDIAFQVINNSRDGNNTDRFTDGLNVVNEQFNRELAGLTEENADTKIFNLGSPSSILLSAGVEDKPMKLYGNKVIKKMKKHGFALEELQDLPRAVANPIAVFNNYQREGNRTILTELRSQGKNIMVAITLGKDGVDVDFNIVSSVFGKGSTNIVDWISKGYLAYVDKEKALNYLYFSESSISEAADNVGQEDSTNLHHSALSAEALSSSRLSSAAKIVKDFVNPSIRGEKSSLQGKIDPQDTTPQAKALQAKMLSEKLNTPIRVVSDPAEISELPSRRQQRAKGWWSAKNDEVVILLPNNADVADVANTAVHEVVGHKGLRKLIGEERFDEFLDEVYDHATNPIRTAIDEAERKLFDTEVDRLTQQKNAEAERPESRKGVFSRAEATVEANKKREQMRREATEEYMADMAGRIGDEGFEKMSAEELTFWGKVKAKVQQFLDKFLRGLKIAKGVRLTDKDVAYILYKSWKNLRNGGKPTIMDAAEDALMRNKTNYNESDISRFRDGDMGLDETITNMKAEISAANKDDFNAKVEAMKAIGGNLQKLRSAMSRQRSYDISTAKAMTDLAQVLLDKGLLDNLSVYETKRVLSAVRNGVGKEDISGHVQKLMDIMVDNQLHSGANMLGKLFTMRGTRLNDRGIEVQGNLDPQGQILVKTARKYTSFPKEEIDNTLIPDLMSRMGSDDQTIADNAAIEYAGAQIARRYVEEITESKVEEKALRESIKTAKEDKDAGKLDAEAYKQYVNATEEAIRQNKIDRAEAYSSIAAEFGGMLGESAKRANEWRKAEQERINDIHHNCNSDMEGRITDEHHKDNKVQKLMNNDIVRFFLAPLGTFDQMLRMFGKKNVNGEGYLWNRFMRSWVDATENEYTGYRDDLKELDAKVSEVYGKKMKWADLFTLERKMGKVPVEFWDGGERKLHELTQGNLLYIYMVDKMSDGRMKLRYMGITEQDVQHITEILDPKFKELADWLQDEYLVNKRNKYNEVHKRMFGAPMAAIDNYFPLKILKNALDKEEDVAEDDNAGIVLPGTTTNGIIKRTRNNKPLDVTGADAFNVIADHLQEMEHWAAFAELTRDINTMLSYKRFRNQVMNMSSAYGAGAVLWKNFRNVCKMAVGAYRPPSVALDKSAVNIAKGVTAAKVSFRVFTALKQFLSFPAYLPDSNPVYLAQSVVNPAAAWKWSMSNLPIFEKRWKSRMAGDPRLMKSDMDWKAWRSRIVEIASMIGMSPNAFVDALTVSMGAYAMYKTRYDKYKRWGFDEETADKHAKQDATILYNSTQQSSEGAFLSTMQVDRSWFTVLLSIFRNSSMSYERQEYDAFRNEVKLFTPDYRQRAEEFMIKQLQREGLTEEQAKKAAHGELRKGPLHNLARIFVFGFAIQAIWNLGAYLPYLLVGDDDDEKSKMTDDALTHALFGSLEGLTSGDVLSQAGNMALQGEWNWAQVVKDMPAASDFIHILKTYSKDNVEALNDCINLLTQSAVGVNPQSITDAMVAIMDYCGDDAQTSRECALLMARILNCPQSQLDKIYFDELSASGVEASKMTPSQIAERFARYKRHRSAPLTGWMYSDAAIADKDGKRKETVYKKARENFKAAASKSNKEELEQWKAEYKETAAKLSAIKKLREQDEDEADEQMDALENTPEYDRYLIMKDYNSDMNDITKAWLNSKSPTEREQLTKAMFKVQQEMVNELKTSK